MGARGLFSADLHSMSGPSEQPEARTLQTLEDVSVLLLRGESGDIAQVVIGTQVCMNAILIKAIKPHALGLSLPDRIVTLKDVNCRISAIRL